MTQEVKLVQITFDELQAMMVKVVTDEMERAKKFLSKTTKQSDYLTKKEVTQKLKISIGTLNNRIKEKKIPFHKIGRRVLFKESEIEKYIDQSKNDQYGI